MIKTYIEKYKEEMKSDLAKLVSYNSILSEAKENAPFGEENALCLEEGLKLAEKCGMKATNLDYYCGYGEIGSGEEVVGVLGHLDIVPVGEGWNSDPLTLTLKDGKFYGRGVSDDKGAVVASAYAIRILKEMNTNFNKRVRLIMGCNEESGSQCLKYYVEKEGHIDCGFTPDASFPGVFGEKGMVAAKFSAPTTTILAIEGGSVSNVVCAKVKIEIPLNTVDLVKLEDEILKQGLKVEIESKDTVHITVYGVAAHASTPEEGKNAIAHLMVALKKAGFEDNFVDFYNEKIALSTSGKYCNVELQDEYGALTFCNGVIKKEGNVVGVSIDIRFPVTLNCETVVSALKEGFASNSGSLEVLSTHEPLFFEKESPLVKSLVEAYRSVTHDVTSEPSTMGGGTYAKGINNCVAYGSTISRDNHIHDANESLNEDEFYVLVEIYAQAILNLLAI